MIRNMAMGPQVTLYDNYTNKNSSQYKLSQLL